MILKKGCQKSYTIKVQRIQKVYQIWFLTPFCNLKLHILVFYDFPHKTVKKITEITATLLIRKILKKGCQQPYIIKFQRIQRVYQICFLTPFCNVKLHFAAFYGLPHKTVKKIAETTVKSSSQYQDKFHAHCGHFQSFVVRSGTDILQCAKAFRRHVLCHVNFPHEGQSKSWKPNCFWHCFPQPARHCLVYVFPLLATYERSTVA